MRSILPLLLLSLSLAACDANYAWNDAFSLPTTSVSIPYGHVDYANDDSQVFDQKKGCK